MMTDNEWREITAKRDALAEMLERQAKTPARQADQLTQIWDHYRNNGMLPGNADFEALYPETLWLRRYGEKLRVEHEQALLDLAAAEDRIADLEQTMHAVREAPDVTSEVSR